jgi:hypothetical protein
MAEARRSIFQGKSSLLLRQPEENPLHLAGQMNSVSQEHPTTIRLLMKRGFDGFKRT